MLNWNSSWNSRLLNHPLLKKYRGLFREDLTATYSRDIQEWLLVAPIVGIATGVMITGVMLASRASSRPEASAA